jgi:hypothetical protein
VNPATATAASATVSAAGSTRPAAVSSGDRRCCQQAPPLLRWAEDGLRVHRTEVAQHVGVWFDDAAEVAAADGGEQAHARVDADQGERERESP